MKVSRIDNHDQYTIIRVTDDSGMFPCGVSVFISTGRVGWDILYGWPNPTMRLGDDITFKTSFGYYTPEFMKIFDGAWSYDDPSYWEVGDELQLCAHMGAYILLMDGTMVWRRDGLPMTTYEAILELTDGRTYLSPKTYNIEVDPWFLRSHKMR